MHINIELHLPAYKYFELLKDVIKLDDIDT